MKTMKILFAALMFVLCSSQSFGWVHGKFDLIEAQFGKGTKISDNCYAWTVGKMRISMLMKFNPNRACYEVTYQTQFEQLPEQEVSNWINMQLSLNSGDHTGKQWSWKFLGKHPTGTMFWIRADGAFKAAYERKTGFHELMIYLNQ